MLCVRQIVNRRYQLQHKLGERPARQTWLARDTETNSLVVIKLLASSSQMQWNDLKLFEREAQILRELDHPLIPKYRDYFRIDENTLWFAIAEDYIPGESLQTLLDRGKRFSESEVKKIALELLDILSYLHQLNPPVLHRDIKPSNIILGEDERIYLVDFGSIQDKAVTQGASFTVVGTYGYTPMEQFGGRAVAASDLYALGATLIHLLTRIPPADLLQEDSRLQFEEKIEVSQHLASWLAKMSAPTLKERFHSVSEAKRALESPFDENNSQQPQFEPVARPENRSREQDNYLPERTLQLAEVEEQARQWQESGKKDDYLLFKTQLSEARIVGQQQPLSPLAQSFITKSIEHHEGKGRKSKFWVLSVIVLAGTVIGGILINERLKLRELNAAIENVKNCGELLERERNSGLRRTLANCKTEVTVIENWAKTRSLSGYDFQGAYLNNADLENANLRDTNFDVALLNHTNLKGADLGDTNLKDAELENANLKGVDLSKANLESADLKDADLEGANLSNANLRGVQLWDTNLKDANLESANLKYAFLPGANFEGANLENAKFYRQWNLTKFKGANIKNTIIDVPYKLRHPIYQIRLACHWEEAQYKGDWDKTNDTWIFDEEANQQYIEELKQDKVSSSETPVDCSKWEQLR